MLFKGSNWSRAARISQNVRHAFGIPALSKSGFGKNQSYELLTFDRRYVLNTKIGYIYLISNKFSCFQYYFNSFLNSREFCHLLILERLFTDNKSWC